MTEQLVNKEGSNDFYNKYIANGTTNLKGVSIGKATTFLGKAKTIPRYYATNLSNIRKAEKNTALQSRALKSVKKVGDNSWRLKLQLSKYPHPLFIDDEGQEHVSFMFGTKAEALESYEAWIEQLREGERGVLRAIESAYRSYCSNNDVEMDEDYFESIQEA